LGDPVYLDLLTGFLLQCLDGCGIGAALINRDLVGRQSIADGFREKAQSGLHIAMSRKSMAWPLLSGTVEVLPLAIDLDVRLIHPPTLAHHLQHQA
jgi:hypothetical protein